MISQQVVNLKPASTYTSTQLHEAVKLRIGKQGVAAQDPCTIPQVFREICRKYAQQPALAYKPLNSGLDSAWIKLNYSEYEQHVEQVALMLLHVGLQPRSTVGILAHNCAEWFYAELAAQCAGAVVTGIYPTSSAEVVAHLLDTSDATICIVDTAEQMAKVRAVKKRLPRLRAVIQLQAPFEEFVNASDQGYYRWEDLINLEFKAELKEELRLREAAVCANECALLVFTSGTTGLPKAAMLSHDSIICSSKCAIEMLITNSANDRVVSYLPLNHIAAQIFDLFTAILNGACVYFADRNAIKGTLFKTFQQVRPTIVFGVPRIFEKLQEGLLTSDSNLSTFAKCITERAKSTVLQYYMDIIAEKSSPSRLSYWLATRVTNQIKYALGLENIKYLYVGGAPVSDDLKRYFLSIDLPLMDLYGMTECSGPISFNDTVKNLQTVGKLNDGLELKIDKPDCNGHGELCFKGRSVFMGYLNEPLKTKETIKEDGFCYSGDLGYVDTNGYLYISGRIKEIVVTAGGENIPPVYIEDCIKRELNAISNAVVIGDRRKYLTVLLTLKTEFDPQTGYPMDILHADTVAWLESLNLQMTRLSEVLGWSEELEEELAINTAIKIDAKIVASIDGAIKRANARAQSNAQKVQKFAILPHDLSQATGEYGPTMKICRQIVHKKYAKIIQRLYENN